MRHPKTHEWLIYPCGQCLACRVKKRSAWQLRNLLESRTALSSSFWTLTLNDSGLQELQQSNDGHRIMLRRFFDALRKSESRAGNLTPIRFYGCLEFGGQFGRPHWHLLIYNMLHNYREPLPYRQNLPRPRTHIAQWPHGHIDVAEFNPATINYVCDYLTKFTRPEEKPLPFRTIRPAIGFYGVKSLAESVAKTHGTLPDQPAYFKLGERKYPLDQWTRDKFNECFRKAGGRYFARGNPRDRTYERLAWEAARDACPELVWQETLKQDQMERLLNGKAQKNEQREKAVSAIYRNRQEAAERTARLEIGFSGEA